MTRKIFEHHRKKMEITHEKKDNSIALNTGNPETFIIETDKEIQIHNTQLDGKNHLVITTANPEIFRTVGFKVSPPWDPAKTLEVFEAQKKNVKEHNKWIDQLKILKKNMKKFEYEISKISQNDFDMMKPRTNIYIFNLAIEAGLLPESGIEKDPLSESGIKRGRPATVESQHPEATFKSIIFELRRKATNHHTTAVTYLTRFGQDIISTIHHTNQFLDADGELLHPFEVHEARFSKTIKKCMNLIKTGLEMARAIGTMSTLQSKKSPFENFPLEILEKMSTTDKTGFTGPPHLLA